MSTTTTTPPISLALVACMANEQHILRRCLRSAAKLVDHYVLCNTGLPDDATQRGLQEFVDEAMPHARGHVLYNPWIDYGTNRTWLLDKAYELLAGTGVTHVLWLDADEVFVDPVTLETNGDQLRARLHAELAEKFHTADMFHFNTEMGFDTWPRDQVVRFDLNRRFEWWAPCHEKLRPLNKQWVARPATLTSVFDFARAEGHRSLAPDMARRKGEEYCRLYENWFPRTPDGDQDPYVQFHYAQSLDQAQRQAEAARWYARRFYNPDPSGAHSRYLAAVRLSIILAWYYRDGKTMDEVARKTMGEFYRDGMTELTWLEWACQLEPERLEAINQMLVRRNHLLNTNDAERQRTAELARAALSVLDRLIERYGAGDALLRALATAHLQFDRAVVEHGLLGACTVAFSNAGLYDEALAVSTRLLEYIERNKCYSEWDFVRHARANHAFIRQKLAPAAAAASPNPYGFSGLSLVSPAPALPSVIVPSNRLPLPKLVVFDDFLEDTRAWRQFALAQSFSVTGNYPGKRTASFASGKHPFRELFNRVLAPYGREVTYFAEQPGTPDAPNYNGAFQMCTASERRSWVHRDQTDYAGLLYLTPDAPLSGGTTFYRHRRLRQEQAAEGSREAAQMDQSSQALDDWEVVDYVGNRFGRLVLFCGLNSHMSGDYFGTTPETARLFQVFFFNATEKTSGG